MSHAGDFEFQVGLHRMHEIDRLRAAEVARQQEQPISPHSDEQPPSEAGQPSFRSALGTIPFFDEIIPTPTAEDYRRQREAMQRIVEQRRVEKAARQQAESTQTSDLPEPDPHKGGDLI